MKKDTTFKSLLVISVIAIAIATFIDFVCAWVLPISLRWPFYVCYSGFWLLLMLSDLANRFNNYKLLVVLAFLSAMVAIYFIPWSTRKPFLRHLYSIKPGMTVSEVESIMSGYMKGSGLPWPPIWDDEPKSFSSTSSTTTQGVIKGEDGEIEIPGSIIYRHSDEGSFNADWGQVNFKDGRVESVEFLPD